MARSVTTGGLSGALVATTIAVGLAADATAEDRFWNDPNGGLFGDGTSWDDGEGEPPGSEDVAIFDLESAFEVRFIADRATDRVLVRRGAVTFVMDPSATYTLLNGLGATPGIAIAEQDAATLALVAPSSVVAPYAHVGIGPASAGALDLEGAGTFLGVDDEVRLGDAGHATLRVADGAALACGHASVGVAEGARGEVTVTGAGADWTCRGLLVLGTEGEADLCVEGGAFVTADRAVLAEQLDATANVAVRGTGSTLSVTGTLDVGMLGLASVTVEDGGHLANGTFATIGTFPWEESGEGGTGIVTVRGGTSVWTVEGDLYVGFLSHGTLILSRGGRVQIDGDLYRAQSSGTTRMIVELGDHDDYTTPALEVGGQADGFVARVLLVDGFVPRAGDEFQVAFVASGAGGFEFQLPPLPNSLMWEVLHEANVVRLVVVSACGPADLDGSGIVDFGDVLAVLVAWGPCEGCPEDLDESGAVDFGDVLVVLGAWGPCDG